jgi:hypothetical protein
MLATVGRDVALEKLNIEHIAVRSLIDELNDEEKLRPDTIEYGLYPDQELSFKDLLAHLICYEAYSLEAIDAWKRGEKHWIIDAMQSPSEGRRVHYAGIEDRRGKSWAEVLDEWERTQSGLMDAIGHLSDEEWKSPAPFPTSTPLDLGGMLEIILVAPPRPVYRHLPVHIPDTLAYVNKLRGV